MIATLEFVISVPKDAVPLRERLVRKRINPGDCLSHIPRLIEVMPLNAECPYTICMGPLRLRERPGCMLHCWLESGDVVADLTRPLGTAFIDRDEYYSVMLVEISDVKRYTLEQAFEKSRETHQWLFWDFDTTRYWTKDGPPTSS